jgi:hypothetical protein
VRGARRRLLGREDWERRGDRKGRNGSTVDDNVSSLAAHEVYNSLIMTQRF